MIRDLYPVEVMEPSCTDEKLHPIFTIADLNSPIKMLVKGQDELIH